MKRSFTVTLDEPLVKILDQEAKDSDRSRNYVINQRLAKVLSRGALHPRKNSSNRSSSK
jgi:predicted transcriptional regulator